MIGAVPVPRASRCAGTRWLAAGIGFVGVLIVVAPKLSGTGGCYHLVMLASAPVFAASFLLTKALTRRDSTGVIVVWQAISVTLFTPAAGALALADAEPAAMGWLRCLRRARQHRPLLPDALVPRRRHLVDPVGASSSTWSGRR